MGVADDDDQAAKLTPEDLAVLGAAQRGNEWLRAILCTLARRGLAFRHQAPERSAALLAALSRYPFYKAGQFLFDLLEWEDFMLDGPAPSLVPTALDPRALQRLAGLLDQVRLHLDGEASVTPVVSPADITLDSDDLDSLPPLEPSLYLYQDVVLGVLCSARGLLAAVPRAEETPPRST